MKRRNVLTYLTYLSLGSVLSQVTIKLAALSLRAAETTQAQNISSHLINVRQFGALISGITNNPVTIAANTATIQTAIEEVGRNGGGNIYIPAGLYQIAPPDLNVESPASIIINHDNITLTGDGIGKTILQSRGDWSIVNRQVVRGHGILIKGGNHAGQLRKNVTIRNLELSGGTNGFTGERGFPANFITGDGWDITHKGIVLDFDKYLDNITIDSVYIHDFRGELIYAGGIGVGQVTISNTKLHNSNASMLSLEADLTVTNCEFSQTATAWVEIAPLSPNKVSLFQKCIFKDSIYQGVVLAQGNFPFNQKHIITNCSFYNSPAGVCAFGGSANFIIKDNVFIDCQIALFTSGTNHDIEFVNNQIKGEKQPVTTTYIWAKQSHVFVRNNSHIGAENLPKIACIFYYGDLQNIFIENNRFENCRTPEQLADLSNERPLFRDNLYINVERRPFQGTAIFWQQPPYTVIPKHEEVIIINNTGNPVIEVDMNTDHYVNGQEVFVMGGASNARVKFPQNSRTIQCHSDRYLSGQGEQLRLRFQKSDKKWYEVSFG
jgi:Right handed beta helix region